MANKIIIKNGSGAPPSGSLDVAELGFDRTGKKVYIGHTDGPIEVGTSDLKIDINSAISGTPNLINADTLGGKAESTLNVARAAEADNASYAANADYAANATNAGTAEYATNAGTANNAEYATNANNANALEGHSVQALFNKIYPIGSVYMSVNSVSPGTLFGGTWEQLKDRFLLAAGSTYAAGTTGGEATHTLTINEMPSHSHEQYVGANSGSWGVRWDYDSDAQVEKYPQGLTGPAGGSRPHNNMPPYLAVYMWKRTA